MATNVNPHEPSRGIGDTIAKFTKATGIDKLVDAGANLLGIEDCGCEGRRQAMNEMFPYQHTVESTDETPAYQESTAFIDGQEVKVYKPV